MTFWKWSQTAATNASADSTVNWAEGQAPSSVNDSARAMMAAAAKYRDDISGVLIALGSSSALTVTTNQGQPTTPTTGHMVSFRPNFNVSAGATLALDGGTAYPIQLTLGVPIADGVLIGGTPYSVFFNGAVWLVRDFYGNPYNMPLGGLMPYVGGAAPNSAFAFPFGQALSRTTYAALYALTGNAFGAGDGSTTFNILDIRGRVPAGVDNMGGSAAGRLTGYTINSTGGAASVFLTRSGLPNVAPTFTGASSAISATFTSTSNQAAVNLSIGGAGNFGSGGFATQSISGTVTGTTVAVGTVQDINGGVTQTATPTLQPTIALNYILRII